MNKKSKPEKLFIIILLFVAFGAITLMTGCVSSGLGCSLYCGEPDITYTTNMTGCTASNCIGGEYIKLEQGGARDVGLYAGCCTNVSCIGVYKDQNGCHLTGCGGCEIGK